MRTILILYVILSLGAMVNCIITFSRGNIEAGMGWIAATLLGISEVATIIYLIEHDETE
jgi:hypothetical protein